MIKCSCVHLSLYDHHRSIRSRERFRLACQSDQLELAFEKKKRDEVFACSAEGAADNKTVPFLTCAEKQHTATVLPKQAT